MIHGWAYFLTGPAQRELRRVDPDVRARILDALDRYALTGQGDARKLSGRPNDWRLRVGDYRAIFRRDDAERLLIVTAVRHRREAYRG